MIRTSLLGAIISVTIGLVGCQRAASSSAAKATAAPPAKVANIAKEDQLNTIELTPKAAERLGITTFAVEMRSVRRTRTYGGEVILPTGASIVVSAPLSGHWTREPCRQSVRR